MKKRVLVIVSGGIAAYKSCDIVRRLQDAGCDVRVCMTPDATKFVGPITFEALSHHPVLTNLFDFPESPNPHIMMASWADLCLVCPATADIMAKVASGIADDALTTTALTFRGSVLLAPAMNENMWNSPVVQDNLAKIVDKLGVRTVGPDTGHLACGTSGKGRMAEPADILEAVQKILSA